MSALRRMLSSRIARARAAEKRSALEGEIAVVNSRKEKNRASSVSRTQQHTSQFSLFLFLSLSLSGSALRGPARSRELPSSSPLPSKHAKRRRTRISVIQIHFFYFLGCSSRSIDHLPILPLVSIKS